MEITTNVFNFDGVEDSCFEIYDYVRDIRALLDDIYNTFEQSWDVTFDMLCEFVNEFGRFPCFKEEYKSYRLGDWCINQRTMYNRNQLSPYKIQSLEKIGFPWNVIDDLWNRKYNVLKKFKEENGRFIILSDTYKDDKIEDVYRWCTTQRKMYKEGKMSEERINKLKDIGFELSVLTTEERWERTYEKVKSFYDENHRFPLKNDIENGKINIKYSWITTQRNLLKENKLSEEQISKLNQVGFVWDTDEKSWNTKFEFLQQFIKDKNRVPKTIEKYLDCDIGQWYHKQLMYIEKGLLNDERKNKLSSIDRVYTPYNDEMWFKSFELLERFVYEKHRIPYSMEMYEGVNLYNWIN